MTIFLIDDAMEKSYETVLSLMLNWSSFYNSYKT